MSQDKPLFLAEMSYRSRRLGDAARLLPVLGTFLLVLPAMWPDPAGGQGNLSGTIVYLFGIWAALILAAAMIARRLARLDAAGAGAGSEPSLDQDPGA